MNMVGTLTIEEMKGYIICIQDNIDSLKNKLKDYKEALKYRKKFD